VVSKNEKTKKKEEMKQPLTKKQSIVYKFIKECIEDEYSPTLQEIADTFVFSNHSTAQYYVNTLIEKGWLSRKKGGQIKIL